MKNKKLLWILVMVILVVGSLTVTALTNPFSGVGTKIGEITGGTRMTYLLVNTLLIGLFIFVVVHFLPENFGGKFFKPKSKSGNVVLIIALIGISIVYAVRIGDMFIWNEEAVVKPAFRYLFTQDAEGHLGILRPTRILIFLGTSFLLSWLFISVVKIGQGKYNQIDIVIAVILAAEMTHQGLTRGMLVALGQIISIWLLYRQFKREGETGISTSALVWSFGLVIWISAIAFPGEGFLKPFTWLVKVIGHFNYLLLVIIAAIIATVVTGFVKKREKEAKEKEKERRWKENIIAYPLWYLLRWLGKVRNPIVRYIYKRIDPKITTPEGLIPFPFKDLRVEFMTLMNYMLRLEVFKAKKNYITKTQQFMDDDIYSKIGLHQIVQLDRINTNLNVLKNGGGFELNKDGFFEPIIKEIINEKGEKEKLEAGFNSKEWFIYKLINNLKMLLEKHTFIGEHQARDIQNDLDITMGSVDDYLVSVRSRWGCAAIDKETDRFTGMAMRKGAYNLLEGRRIFILDQYRHHGRYNHTYKFARKGANIYNVGVIDQGTNPNNSELKSHPKYTGTNAGGNVEEEFKYEVDTNGYFIDDLNEFIVEGKNKGYIRKVNPQDVVEYNFFNDAAKWLEAEWDFFVWDVRDGRYHPNSRSAKDYNDLHALRSFNYSNVKPHSGPIGRENPAFDRQALLDIAFDYIGRKNVRGIREADVSKANIRPCISTLGIREYILGYLEAKMRVDRRFRENLSMYAYDTGSEKAEVDVFTRAPQEVAKEK